MIKQICPQCLNPVTLPDEVAGKDVDCPLCKKSFAVQARYHPVVTPSPPPPLLTTPPSPEPEPMSTVPPEHPAPPPGYVPPAAPSYAPPQAPLAPYAGASSGYSHAIGITFSPRLFGWLPAICLLFTLFATFFSWVGVYAGGYAVYGQGPWKAMYGGHSVDRQLEAAVRDQIPDQGRWLDHITANWILLLPYLFFLSVATVFACAERRVASLDHTRLPPPLRWVRTVWPYRILFVAVLTTLCLILILVQVVGGFGLQQAAKQNVAKKFEERRKEVGMSASGLAKIDFEEEQELSKYNLERTSFYYLGLGMNLLAMLTIFARMGLENRGTKPPPRLLFQY